MRHITSELELEAYGMLYLVHYDKTTAICKYHTIEGVGKLVSVDYCMTCDFDDAECVVELCLEV